MGQIRELKITINDNTGGIDCYNIGGFTDNELVGLFETLKTLYLNNILKNKSSYYPNFNIGDEFDKDIKEK